MPSRTDTAGHTKAFGSLAILNITQSCHDMSCHVMSCHCVSHGARGGAEMFNSASGTRTDNASVHSPTRYPLSQPGSPGVCVSVRSVRSS